MDRRGLSPQTNGWRRSTSRNCKEGRSHLEGYPWPMSGLTARPTRTRVKHRASFHYRSRAPVAANVRHRIGGVALLTLFGDLNSGNVHKAQMILRRIGMPYRRVDAAQSRGEPRTKEFLEINPIGKVPTVLFDNGDVLSESGAILYFFGKATDLWPNDVRAQSEVLRWMFFEQYSHESSIAVMRYLKHYTTGIGSASRIRELEPKAHHALGVMEKRLSANEWLAGETCSIADFALYPYTRVMDESGIDPRNYSSVNRWLGELEDQENFLVMGRDGAQKSITFAEYVLESAK